MSSAPAPETRAPSGRAALAAAVLGGLGLLAVYGYASFALPGDADIRRFSSGIFDMDVSRVVADLATGQPAYRQSVHPLQKLLVAPFGRALNAVLFGGRNPLGAARLLIAVCMTLQTLAAGALAWQLARRSLSAALAAACVCAFSFSTWLAASIPESAAVASLATVLPLLFLGARWRRDFPKWEALCWGLLAVLGVGQADVRGRGEFRVEHVGRSANLVDGLPKLGRVSQLRFDLGPIGFVEFTQGIGRQFPIVRLYLHNQLLGASWSEPRRAGRPYVLDPLIP